jgi:DNA polymerase
MTVKRDLINYVQFLRDSGNLYAEGEAAEAAAASVPVQSDLFGGTSPKSKPTIHRPPIATGSATEGHGGVLGGEDLPRDKRIQRLAELTARAEACRECALGSRRNKLVFADGDPEAKIAIVGEAPGGEEDQQGLPFVGRAGKLLDKMVVAIGFQRREVYICNTLKCRPPDNRDPTPGEKAACEHFLVAQLEIVRPRIVVALGAHAAQYLCRSEEGIGRLRGTWHSYHGIPLRATYHPAFLLRSPGFKPKSWDDFQAIHAKYGELCPDDARRIWQKEG